MYACLLKLLWFIQGLARGGITLDMIFEYVISWKICDDCSEGSSILKEACIDVSQGWPDNRIEIYAWYQVRQQETCEGQVSLLISAWHRTIVASHVLLKTNCNLCGMFFFQLQHRHRIITVVLNGDHKCDGIPLQ